jgi:WD40 repeat protein
MLKMRAATAALAAVAGVYVVVSAATPTFWTVGTQADFLKGDVENLSIDSDGRVLLGPSASMLAETAAPFLWTLHAGSDGTLWAGSGNEGKLLRIGKDGKATTFFDAGELEVHAVAMAPGGGLYVGTSPDGRIYHVAADGTSRTLFDPDDKYIWSLAVDRAGNLFAATGDKGVIYKVTSDGKGTPFYRTNTTNVVSLSFDKDGDLLAGTESPGRVFRIDSSGKAFVLLDSPYREIHALRVAGDGTIFAAAVNGGSSSGPSASEVLASEAPRPPVPTVSAEITGVSPIESPISGGTSSAPSAATSKRAGRGAIYRIRPDGLWDLLWDAGDDSPFDMLIEPGGGLLVGTGTEGKIFRVAGDPARATLLARAGARQVTAMLRDASGRIIGATSNPGKVFALTSEPAKSGTYESDIRDAGTVASWGVIRWRAALNGGKIDVSTRTGNTSTPDETWSVWSKPYSNGNGEQIASPNARYLQWRMTMTSTGGPGPVLTSVTAAYLPRNLRPIVSSITVHPAGTVFQRPFSTGEPEIAGYQDNSPDGRQPNASPDQRQGSAPPLGRRLYQKGLQTFVWKAEDGNDDRLQYVQIGQRHQHFTWRHMEVVLKVRDFHFMRGDIIFPLEGRQREDVR